eukprot:TRINITY_DN87995_c1_g1_i1.p1 TRINITY_DN87995_c1_g1~~TRINITY_DN87995_c1_g1_i1.p1  ORF type:complete len:785 (+),score=143.39 TRINITY_DN87995_c1_g1_i1:8534-10888(+)
MDELEELLKADLKPSHNVRSSKRPHTATEDLPLEGDDIFSHGIKSHLHEADDLISLAQGSKVGLPPKSIPPRKSMKEPPRSAHGFLPEDDDKEQALEAILSSLEKPEVSYFQHPEQKKEEIPTPQLASMAQPMSFGEEPEEREDVAQTRKKRTDLFGLRSNTMNVGQETTSLQPNPYVNVELADQSEARRFSPDVGRVKTPIMYPPMSSDNLPVMPATVQPAEIIPPERSRRKTKMLGRTGTAGEGRQSNPSGIVTASVGFKEEDTSIRKDPLSKTDMGKAKEVAKDEIFANLIATSLSRRSGGTDKREEPEPAPAVIKEPTFIPPAPAEKRESILSGKPSITKKPMFLMDDEEAPAHTLAPPIITPKITEAPPVVVAEAKEPERAPEPPLEKTPPKPSAEYKHIEITGNMNRHQVAEINIKLKEMTQELARMSAENQRLSAIGKNFDEEKNKATAELREELDKTKEELVKVKEENRNEVLKIKEDYNKQLTELQDQHKRTLEIHEEEKVQQQEMNKKEIEREIEKLSQLHKLELEKIGKMQAQRLEGQRKELESEIQMLKQQLGKNEELTKITVQVDSIVEDLKNKMENELRTKYRAIADKEQALESDRRKVDTEFAKLELEKKRIEDLKQSLVQKEKQLEANAEEQKRLFQYKKEALEAQHDKALKDLEARQIKYLDEQKKLEMERAQFEKVRDEWEIIFKDQKGQLALERAALDKESQDLNQISLENNTYHFYIHIKNQRTSSQKDGNRGTKEGYCCRRSRIQQKKANVGRARVRTAKRIR